MFDLDSLQNKHKKLIISLDVFVIAFFHTNTAREHTAFHFQVVFTRGRPRPEPAHTPSRNFHKADTLHTGSTYNVEFQRDATRCRRERGHTNCQGYIRHVHGKGAQLAGKFESQNHGI